MRIEVEFEVSSSGSPKGMGNNGTVDVPTVLSYSTRGPPGCIFANLDRSKTLESTWQHAFVAQNDWHHPESEPTLTTIHRSPSLLC